MKILQSVTLLLGSLCKTYLKKGSLIVFLASWKILFWRSRILKVSKIFKLCPWLLLLKIAIQNLSKENYLLEVIFYGLISKLQRIISKWMRRSVHQRNWFIWCLLGISLWLLWSRTKVRVQFIFYNEVAWEATVEDSGVLRGKFPIFLTKLMNFKFKEINMMCGKIFEI